MAWSQLLFQFIPKVFDGIEVRALKARQVLLYQTKQTIFRPCFVHEGSSPSCCHNAGSTQFSRKSLYAVALRFPFTVTEVPETMKNSPRPLFLLFQMLQLTLGFEPGHVLLYLPNPDSSVRLMMLKCDSSLQSMCFHCFKCVKNPIYANSS